MRRSSSVCPLILILALVVGCSSSSGDGNAGGMTGSGGGAGSAVVSGSGGAAQGGTGAAAPGGSGQGGIGGQGGTSGAGGASTAGTGSDEETGLGETCAYTDNTSMLNAIPYDSCDSGYCVWDSRFLLETYCTIPCEGVGAPCPDGYACSEDLGTPGNFWCVHPEPVAPADMGAACESTSWYCRNTQYSTESFCLDGYAESCATEKCVHDPILDANYCSMSCSSRVACPEGYDCTRHPNGGISPDYHEFCVQRHEPAAYVGLPCYQGSEHCDARPCPTYEDGYGCSPTGSGICVFDNRSGRLTTYNAYCSARCEDTACPTGFVCSEIALTGGGGPPSGAYCVSEI